MAEQSKLTVRTQSPISQGLNPKKVYSILKVSARKYQIIERVSTTQDDKTGIGWSLWQPVKELGRMTWIQAFNKIIELKAGIEK